MGEVRQLCLEVPTPVYVVRKRVAKHPVVAFFARVGEIPREDRILDRAVVNLGPVSKEVSQIYGVGTSLQGTYHAGNDLASGTICATNMQGGKVAIPLEELDGVRATLVHMTDEGKEVPPAMDPAS